VKTPSESRLPKRCNWWWRKLADLATPEWYQTCHRSAYLYELGMRVTGKYEFGVAYTELTPEQCKELAHRWPLPYTNDTRHFIVTTQGYWHPRYMDRKPRAAGWSMPWVLSINLRWPDETILRSLKSLIEKERAHLKIKPDNRQDKLRSWRAIECMDIQRLKVRPLDDGERSQISKARKQYAQALREAKTSL
jgi:hypothetical protein